MAALLAGLPTSVPGNTVNRLCGSSLDAAMQASRAIETGDADVVLVGGVESMSRAPWVVLKPEKGFPAGPQTMHSTTLGWRMVNPDMPDAVDDLARREHREARRHPRHRPRGAGRVRAAQPPARRRRLGRRLLRRLGRPGRRHRAHARRGHPRRLARSRSWPSSSRRSSRTARSPRATRRRSTTAPPRVLIASEAGAQKAGREPLARIAGRGTFAVDPDIFGIGPVEAANRALKRAGIGWGDVDAVELNEAFAAQSLACVGEWKELDPERVNVNGGAIAIGHPLGASGGADPRHAGLRAQGATAGGTASPRSASASARGSRSCWRPCDTFRDDTREPSPARLPGLQVDAAAAPEAAADRAPAAAHRGHRAGARRGPARRARPRPHAPARGRAAGPADHRPRPRQGGRRPRRCRHAGRDLAGQRRRPLPPPLGQLAEPDRPELQRRRALPDRQAGLLPLRHDPARARTRGATTPTPGGPRTSTSRSSGARSRSGS